VGPGITPNDRDRGLLAALGEFDRQMAVDDMPRPGVHDDVVDQADLGQQRLERLLLPDRMGRAGVVNE
jgi:hypothetical protein